jgi:hypothetical protein
MARLLLLVCLVLSVATAAMACRDLDEWVGECPRIRWDIPDAAAASLNAQEDLVEDVMDVSSGIRCRNAARSYACSMYFQECTQAGDKPPCKSLCEDYVQICNPDVLDAPIDTNCAQFTNDNCTRYEVSAISSTLLTGLIGFAVIGGAFGGLSYWKKRRGLAY